MCSIVFASIGCGGGGGSGSGSPVIESIHQTIPVGGGTVTAPQTGVALIVPANALTGSTQISLDVYKTLKLGNPDASKLVSDGVKITVDESAIGLGATLQLSMPITPGGNDPTYGVMQIGDGVSICPTTISGDGTHATLSIAAANLTSFVHSRAPETSNVVLTLGVKSALKPVSNPTALVDLYHLNGVSRYGDPDASPSVYKQDFDKNWSLVSTPHFGANRVAIVIHGIRNDLSNLTELAAYLKDLKAKDGTPYYHDVYGADTEWRASIADNGGLFANLIAAGGDDSTTVDVFAHSQGGLISRYAIEHQLGQHASHPKIARLFTLGTPHLGVPLVGIHTAAENGIFNYWPGVDDLQDTSTFIQDLNGNPALTKTDYITLAGDDFADAYGIGGKLVHKALGVDCDGIVPVYSAQGALIADHAHTLSTLPVFHLTHSKMRGIREPSPTLDLDAIGEQRLRDYILGTDIGVVIK